MIQKETIRVLSKEKLPVIGSSIFSEGTKIHVSGYIRNVDNKKMVVWESGPTSVGVCTPDYWNEKSRDRQAGF